VWNSFFYILGILKKDVQAVHPFFIAIMAREKPTQKAVR
jgi:hypothetical protein